MTSEEHARLTAALVRKVSVLLAHAQTDPDPQPAWIDVAVGAAVADTALFCEGIITLEMMEQ